MNSFIGWIGGKRMLRKAIIERFPSEKVGRYIEVFGGAGWVLFGKEKYPYQMEVFNDLDSELINLFRCIKYHREAVQEELKWLLSSRELYFDYMEQISCRGMTDIQRAARFYCLVKFSFGSDGRTFATSAKSIGYAVEYLDKVQERLQGVVIEHKDFADLIRVYDRENALFYLDPPYVGTEKYYKVSFPAKDHQRLSNILKGIKGRFILSYNDNAMVRELYKDFNIEGITRRNTLSIHRDNKVPYAELIIRNY